MAWFWSSVTVDRVARCRGCIGPDDPSQVMIVIDGLFDGIDQELATSMGQAVLIERLREPYGATVQGDAGVGFSDLEADRIPGQTKGCEHDRDRRRRLLGSCRPDRALGVCGSRPLCKAGA